MANIDNIKVLCFSSDNFNLDELNAMTDNERFDLCYDNESFGTTEIMTLSGFQNDFNHGHLDDTEFYIFFH